MSMPADSSRNVPACAHEVSEGLDTQRSLLEELHQLATSQGPLIAAAEHDSLLTLVRRRQELVNRLDQVRAGMAVAVDCVKADIDQLAPDIRDGLRARVGQVQQLVDQIAAIDSEDARRLEHQQATCREQLERLAATTTAREGYRDTMKPPARFADAKG